jgi:hypothetical protein
VSLRVRLPAGEPAEGVEKMPPLPPFSDAALDFVETVSRTLLETPSAREHPDVVAFAFWARRRHMQSVARRFHDSHAGDLRVPRGLVFHIAPSNVDTLFAYSWMVSMLCGNTNVVRLSTAAGSDAEVLLQAFGDALAHDRFCAIRDRIRIVEYEHDDAINLHWTQRCDTRVIWGGDATIAALRRLPLPPTSTELCFPDKASLAVIDAGGFLALADDVQRQQALLFRADVTGFQQRACSSPRLVAWVGARDEIESARERFWRAVEAAPGKPAESLAIADRSRRLLYVQEAAIAADATLVGAPGDRFVRLWLTRFDVLPTLPFSGGGVVLECAIASLRDIEHRLDRRIQTVAVAGFAPGQVRSELAKMTLAGIDRVVPFGQALAFDETWDGVDLLEAFTRRIAIRT